MRVAKTVERMQLLVKKIAGSASLQSTEAIAKAEAAC